jgi:hypothetical protein
MAKCIDFNAIENNNLDKFQLFICPHPLHVARPFLYNKSVLIKQS